MAIKRKNDPSARPDKVASKRSLGVPPNVTKLSLKPKGSSGGPHRTVVAKPAATKGILVTRKLGESRGERRTYRGTIEQDVQVVTDALVGHTLIEVKGVPHRDDFRIVPREQDDKHGRNDVAPGAILVTLADALMRLPLDDQRELLAFMLEGAAAARSHNDLLVSHSRQAIVELLTHALEGVPGTC